MSARHSFQLHFCVLCSLWFFPWASLVLRGKESACQCRRLKFDPWVGKIPCRRKWQPTPVSLPGKIPWTEEPDGLQSMRSQRVRHNLVNEQQQWFFHRGAFFYNYFTFTFHFHALEKKMATHSSVLAWRISGMGKPGGLPSMGSHRVGHD